MTSALADPVLSAAPGGVVRRCPCCRGVEVRWEGSAVTLTPRQLREMARTVAAVRAEAARAPWGWALRASTVRGTAVFHLRGDGARDLGDLLDAAVAVLDLDALLLDVLGPRPAA